MFDVGISAKKETNYNEKLTLLPEEVLDDRPLAVVGDVGHVDAPVGGGPGPACAPGGARPVVAVVVILAVVAVGAGVATAAHLLVVHRGTGTMHNKETTF